jgi:hypothetical protein
MSTTPSTPAGGPTLWQRWIGFWFTPADPTTLGFMRVVTGLLVLYVHLAYCFDLQAFFGKDGWYSLTAIDRERKESPWMLGSLADYDDQLRVARVPEYPHRRAAVMQFIRGMADRPDRAVTLRYLARLQDLRNQTPIREGLLYLNHVGIAGEHRKARLDALENEALRTPQDVIPDFLKALPATGAGSRKEAREDVERLLDALPPDVIQREYVLNHLIEMDWGTRQAFLDFLVDLPADPVERTKAIDYLEFWNNEASKAHRTGYPIFSLWFHVSDPTSMAVAHAVILGVMVLFTLGLFTRVTSVLTWLAAISYIHRTQHVLFGMDTMMNLLLIYLMIGNSGAALSLDRLINRYRAARASLRRGGKVDAATQVYLDRPPPSLSAGLALRLVQVHFCFIYMASGLSKLKGPAWWSTNAFWDTVINPEFTLVQYQWYEWLIRQLVTFRPVYAAMAAGGVVFTLALEIGLPFLVWTRMRPYVVIAACLFHLGIAVSMGLVLFGLLMMTLLLAYIPGSVIRNQLFGAASAAKAALTLRFNNRSPRQQRAAALAKAFDFDNRVELADTPAAKADAPVKVVGGGRELTGRPAAAALFGAVAFPRLLKGLLAVPGLGGKLAAWFAPADGPAVAAANPAANGKHPVGAK